jgi:hypothetical protein
MSSIFNFDLFHALDGIGGAGQEDDRPTSAAPSSLSSLTFGISTVTPSLAFAWGLSSGGYSGGASRSTTLVASVAVEDLEIYLQMAKAVGSGKP